MVTKGGNAKSRLMGAGKRGRSGAKAGGQP